MKLRTAGNPAKCVDERLGLLTRDTDVLGQRERLLSVEQGVVDDLGAPAELVLAEAAVGAKDFQRRAIVDVLAASERVDEHVVAGQMREHASSICE